MIASAQPPVYGGQYPPAQPPQYQAGVPSQPYPQMGYAVQPAIPAPATNGRIPAILLVLSSLAFVISLFLPFLRVDNEDMSVVFVLTALSEATSRDVPVEAWLFAVIPAIAILSLIFSAMALWKRRQVWGALDLIVGLLLSGISGLLLIGANVSDDPDVRAGSALWVMFAAGTVMFVSSIVYLARKKAPR